MFERFFGPKASDELGKLLQYKANQEELLGVLPPSLPTPDKIKHDSGRIVSYSNAEDYKAFAREAWARVIDSLDKVLDDRSSVETVQYHRAAVKATLDLLRLSYQARAVREQLAKDASLPRQ